MKNSKMMARQSCRLSRPLFLTMFMALLSATVAVGQDVAGTTHVTTQPKGRMPILVLTDSRYTKNPFGSYLPEILRGEGLVEFEVCERSALSAFAERNARLSDYDVVLMAEMDLIASEENLLCEYVSGGGLLVAMRPDADLADLFGIRIAEMRPEKLLQYFAVDGDAAAGSGIVESAMQYHGQAATYSLNGATPLAHLYDDRSLASSHPAASLNRWGKGRAVAFAFDLAKSVVLMRQGNPQWQNTEGDKLSGYRPMDMFMRTNGETYFDQSLLRIPQADEKQRFLANIVVRLAEKPLPRMWYLPGMHKVIVINTGDAESNFAEQLDPVFDACASYGGRFTAYLRGGPNRGIEQTTVQQEAAWRAAGHEVGVHMYAEGAEAAGAREAMSQAYGKVVGDLERKFGHGSRTARNHTIDWTGWVEMAAIEARFGTKMDLNYYHYIPSGTPINTSGYFNGTGLPQRLIDAGGRVLPIYQATTQWPDEWFADRDMTSEQTVKIITEMIQAAQSGYYSAFVNNIHQCRYNGRPFGKDRITAVWPDQVWAYCRDNKIPSWSAEMLLDFVEARSAARFEKITWRTDSKRNRSELSFNFHNPAEDQNLTVMIPSQWLGRTLKSLSADGETLDVTLETVKGIQYGMFASKAVKAHVVAHYAIAGSKR
ncbi:MAG TPA: hypothetical protein QF564_07190 [Pirellulaceae bacterium]|jgi:hypothetical protein|nr:hypothetical protein [Pirellulaceae bacterium]